MGRLASKTSLSCLPPETLHLPSFLRETFCRYVIDDNSFLSVLEKCCALPDSMIRWETLLIKLTFSYTLFLSGYFWGFFFFSVLSFVFRSLIIIYLITDFFQLISDFFLSFQIESPWLLEAKHLCFSPNLGSFCPLLLYFFILGLMSLFSGTPMKQILVPLLLSSKSETATLFSPVYFLSVDQTGSTRSICPQVLWFYPVSSLLYCWAHPPSFYLLLYFSLLYFPFNTFLYSLFLCCSFLFFHLLEFLIACWSIFRTAASKSSSGNSSTWSAQCWLSILIQSVVFPFLGIWMIVYCTLNIFDIVLYVSLSY